ncbi:MAG: hypothetical protein NC097_04930 [Clostridium sp.]|nr:hypothetical protein [Prevotella sp.]MCM1429121.1 hypothetical protein [Clostridium sp.]MCM1475351.1 hypothetical protein [Muribaculaceae bacterium]
MRRLNILPPLLLASAIILSGGCTKKIYVPVEDTRIVRDTIHKTLLRQDSVVLRDSIFVYQKGDTIVKTALKERTRIVCRHDTLRQIVRDTIVQKSVTPIAADAKQKKGLRLWKLLTATIIIGILYYLIKRRYRK